MIINLALKSALAVLKQVRSVTEHYNLNHRRSGERILPETEAYIALLHEKLSQTGS